MEKINYQLETDRVLESLTRSGETPRLLLHACCGPCSAYVLEYLSRYFDITVFYYNPNIRPDEEYRRRLETLEQLIGCLPVQRPVTLVEEGYRPEDFEAIWESYRDEPEGGARCAECIALRLGETARAADKYGCGYFCSTLTVSPWKDSELINTIGLKADAPKSVWLPSDFKKRGGYGRSVELSRELGLYRQDYCGCTPRKLQNLS